MTDLRPSYDDMRLAFGLDAVVTLPDGTVLETDGAIWIPPGTEEIPSGVDLRRAEQINVLALPADDVPQIPRGSIVAVPAEEGGAVRQWRVDATVRVDYDHRRVVVVPA